MNHTTGQTEQLWSPVSQFSDQGFPLIQPNGASSNSCSVGQTASNRIPEPTRPIHLPFRTPGTPWHDPASSHTSIGFDEHKLNTPPSSGHARRKAPSVTVSRRSYPPIAPAAQESCKPRSRKRAHSDKTQLDGSPKSKRPKVVRASSSQNAISEEENLLLRLRATDKPWKDISSEFSKAIGREKSVDALQMRYKRLCNRLRIWTDDDIQALRLAHQHWAESKFELIASKVRPIYSSSFHPPVDANSAMIASRVWRDSKVDCEAMSAEVVGDI